MLIFWSALGTCLYISWNFTIKRTYYNRCDVGSNWNHSFSLSKSFLPKNMKLIFKWCLYNYTLDRVLTMKLVWELRAVGLPLKLWTENIWDHTLLTNSNIVHSIGKLLTDYIGKKAIALDCSSIAVLMRLQEICGASFLL